MQISKHLKVFITLTILYSIVALTFIRENWNDLGATQGISGQLGPNGIDGLVGVIYVVLVILSGLILMKMQKKRAHRTNIALQYHAAASVVATMAGLAAWFLLTYFGWRYIAWTVCVGWGSFGLHTYLARHKNKGIDKQEAFK